MGSRLVHRGLVRRGAPDWTVAGLVFTVVDLRSWASGIDPPFVPARFPPSCNAHRIASSLCPYGSHDVRIFDVPRRFPSSGWRWWRLRFVRVRSHLVHSMIFFRWFSGSGRTWFLTLRWEENLPSTGASSLGASFFLGAMSTSVVGVVDVVVGGCRSRSPPPPYARKEGRKEKGGRKRGPFRSIDRSIDPVSHPVRSGWGVKGKRGSIRFDGGPWIHVSLSPSGRIPSPPTTIQQKEGVGRKRTPIHKSRSYSVHPSPSVSHEPWSAWNPTGTRRKRYGGWKGTSGNKETW